MDTRLCHPASSPAGMLWLLHTILLPLMPWHSHQGITSTHLHTRLVNYQVFSKSRPAVATCEVFSLKKNIAIFHCIDSALVLYVY